LGDGEVETVLRRLDRLTEDEARVTVTQTFGVVHGLMNNMRIVMDGAQAFGHLAKVLLSTYSIRRQSVNKRHSTIFGYMSPSIAVLSMLTWDRSYPSPSGK
jgi:hypothetical protein